MIEARFAGDSQQTRHRRRRSSRADLLFSLVVRFIHWQTHGLRGSLFMLYLTSQRIENLTMSQSFTNLLYHLVFSTKDRRPLITLDYQPRLYGYIGGILRNTGDISLGINGVDDHVHVLAKLRPDKALSDVLRDLKANASGWMHDVFPRLSEFSWQRGYGAFTVSQSNLPQVQRYLANQKQHHQEVSFRDEFITFLKANEIEFDERHV
jgi:REP-associated tyrosine transposase